MKTSLKEHLKRCGALRYGSFTLASGAESSYYVDIKRASTYPRVLRKMSRELEGRMLDEEIECDRLAGVVLGSIPLVVALSMEVYIPYLMVRKERKSHGMGDTIEGVLEPGDRVVMLEDVVTSAGSALEAVEILREKGAVVEDVLAIVDRETGGRELLESNGLNFYPILTAKELMEE